MLVSCQSSPRDLTCRSSAPRPVMIYSVIVGLIYVAAVRVLSWLTVLARRRSGLIVEVCAGSICCS
jgi:hypothetical protein